MIINFLFQKKLVKEIVRNHSCAEETLNKDRLLLIKTKIEKNQDVVLTLLAFYEAEPSDFINRC